MLEHLRRSSLLSMLALFAFITVLGGKEVVHYVFMHEETEAHSTAHVQDCCKPDHRLPHFHADQYCFLCDMDVSVVIHSDNYMFSGAPQICTGIFYADKVAVFSPAVIPCHDLRGPPAA